MSVIATALKHLIAAGMSGDDLVRAVAEMEAASVACSPDPVAEKRRAYDRQRKRDAKVSGGIPVESTDSAENPSPFDKETLSPTPPIKEINIPTRVMGDAPARKGNFPVPEGCDPDDWRDLQANRKAKRLPMTPGAYRKILKDLADQSDAEWPPGRVLRHAAESGWAAIYDPRSSQGTRKNGNRPANDPVDEFVNPMVRAAIRREARSQDRGLGF